MPVVTVCCSAAGLVFKRVDLAA